MAGGAVANVRAATHHTAEVGGVERKLQRCLLGQLMVPAPNRTISSTTIKLLLSAKQRRLVVRSPNNSIAHLCCLMCCC